MRVWFRFLRLFLPYRGRLVLTFLATLVRPLLNAGKIYLLKLIIDNLAQHPNGQIILVICGSYLVIALAKGIAQYGDEYLGAFVGGRVIIDLRQRVFDVLKGLVSLSATPRHRRHIHQQPAAQQYAMLQVLQLFFHRFNHVLAVHGSFEQRTQYRQQVVRFIQRKRFLFCHNC